MKTFITTFGLIASLLFSVAATAAPKSDLWAFWNQSNPSNTETVDHSLWQQTLDRYLDANHASGVNRFDYAGVTDADRAALNNYIQQLEAVKPRQLNLAEQKAYWINLYNALTIQRVLEAYPTKSILKIGGSFFSPGPWNEKLLNIEGQALSLNDVEHRILRPIWDDNRIHFAVNCASIGCPNLLPTAYNAVNTEALLDSAARAYLSHPRGLALDGNKLRLSKIFDWYQVDFGNNEAELLQTLSQWLPNELASTVRSFNGKVKYDYDWGLNQP